MRSSLPVPEDRALLSASAARRSGDEWRFGRRVGLDRVAGRG